MITDKRPLNYSTKIPARRTVGDCQELLSSGGAAAVAVLYENREPVGLSFRLDTAAGRRDFAMPVNVGGAALMIAAMLRDDPPHASRAELTRYATRAHAVNVAWRVIRDWLEAQLAIVAAGMATIDEVMLPYLEIEAGETLYQRYAAQHGLHQLPGGGR